MEIQNKNYQDQQTLIIPDNQAVDPCFVKQNAKNHNLSCNKINGSIYQSRLKHSKVHPGQFVISYNFDDPAIKSRTQNLLIGAACQSPLNKVNKLHKILGKQNTNKQNSFALSRLTNNQKNCSKHRLYGNNALYVQQQFPYEGFGGTGIKKEMRIRPGNKQYNFFKHTESSKLRNNPFDHNFDSHYGKNRSPELNQLSDLSEVPQSTIKKSTHHGNQQSVNGISRSNVRSQMNEKITGYSRIRNNRDANQTLQFLNHKQINSKSKPKQISKKNIKGCPSRDLYKGKSFNEVSKNCNEKRAKRGIQLNEMVEDQQSYGVDGSQMVNAANKNIQSFLNRQLQNQNLKSYENSSKKRKIIRRGSNSQELPTFDQDLGFDLNNLKPEDVKDININEMKTVRKNQSGDFYKQKLNQGVNWQNRNQNKHKQSIEANKNKKVKDLAKPHNNNKRKIPQHIQYIPKKFMPDRIGNHQTLGMQYQEQLFKNQLVEVQFNSKVRDGKDYDASSETKQLKQIEFGKQKLHQQQNLEFENLKRSQKNNKISSNSHIINRDSIKKSSKKMREFEKKQPNRNIAQKDNINKQNKTIFNAKPKQHLLEKQQGQMGMIRNIAVKTSDGLKANRTEKLKHNLLHSQGQYTIQNQHSFVQDGCFQQNINQADFQKEKREIEQQQNHMNNTVGLRKGEQENLQGRFLKSQTKININQKDQNSQPNDISQTHIAIPALKDTNSQQNTKQDHVKATKIRPSQSQYKKSPDSKHKTRKANQSMPQQQKVRQLNWDDRFHVNGDTQSHLDQQKKRQTIQKSKQQRLTHSPYQSSRNSSLQSPPKTANKSKSLSPLSKHKNNKRLIDHIINQDMANTDSSLQYRRDSKDSKNDIQIDGSKSGLQKKKFSKQQKYSDQDQRKIKTKNSVSSGNQKINKKQTNKSTKIHNLSKKCSNKDLQENGNNPNKNNGQNQNNNKKRNSSTKNYSVKKPFFKEQGHDKKKKPVCFKQFQQQKIDKCKQSGQNTIEDQSFWENMRKLQQIQDQQQRDKMENQIRQKAQKKAKNHDQFQDQLKPSETQLKKQQRFNNNKGTLPQLNDQILNRNSFRNSGVNLNQKEGQKNPNNISKLNSLPDQSQPQEYFRQSKNKPVLKKSQDSYRTGNKIQLNPLQDQISNFVPSIFSNRIKDPMGDIQNNLYSAQKPPSIYIEKSPQKYSRAPLVSFLFGLSRHFQQQIHKYQPGQNYEIYDFNKEQFPDYSPKQSIIKQAISILTSIDSWIVKRIIQPINKDTNKIGIWLFCNKTWKCIVLNYYSSSSIDKILQEVLQYARIEYYPCKTTKNENFSLQQTLRMISGIKVLELKNNKRTYKQVHSNIKRNNIVKAMVSDITHFQRNPNEKDLRCCDVTKVQTTVSGSNVVQIRVKKTESQFIRNSRLNNSQNDIPKLVSTQRQFMKDIGTDLIWIKQEKFLQLFNYFLLVCNRQISYWTYFPIEIKKNHKSVYRIQANILTNGAICLYFKGKQKVNLLFYKQIQPKVLKFVGSVNEINNGQNVNFDFTIKGSYYLFIQCEEDNCEQYLLSYEGSSQVSFEFCQFVKSQTLKNQDCEYVEMMKVKKNGFDRFSQIKERFIDFLMKK